MNSNQKGISLVELLLGLGVLLFIATGMLVFVENQQRVKVELEVKNYIQDNIEVVFQESSFESETSLNLFIEDVVNASMMDCYDFEGQIEERVACGVKKVEEKFNENLGYNISDYRINFRSQNGF